MSSRSGEEGCVVATLGSARGRVVVDESGAVFLLSPLFGEQGVAAPGPQSFLVEQQTPGSVVRPHFHAVDQFQLFVAGSGRFGSSDIHPSTLHYSDRETPYGPIVAGSEGVAYLTIRATGDSGPQYMPESRSARTRLRGRHIVAPDATISRHPDGLCAEIASLRPGAALDLDPSDNRNGMHIIVLGGSLRHGDTVLRRCDDVYASPRHVPELISGDDGGQCLVLSFPSDDA